MRLTIIKKLFLFLIFPGFLFFSIFMYYSITNTESIMYSLHQNNYGEQVKGYVALANTYLTQTSNNATYIANIVEEFSQLSEKEFLILLLDNIEQADIIFGSTIAFAPYKYSKEKEFYAPFVYRTPDGIKKTVITSDYTASNFSWYDVPKKTKKPYWTEPYYSNVIKGLKLVSYCEPIIRDGEFIGVSTIDFSLNSFDRIFRKEFEHKSTQFAIISKKGGYISHPNTDKILEGNIFDKIGLPIEVGLREKVAAKMIAGESGFIEQKDSINKTFWGFFAPIPVSDWSIIVYVFEEELNGPIQEVFLESFVFFIITIISSLVMLVFLVRQGIKPLYKLQKFSQKIKDGNYGEKIKINTNDEISDLANDLNIMSEELLKREKELKDINANLERKVEQRTLELKSAKESTDKIIDNSPVPIAVTERTTGKVLRANLAMADFHKIELKDLYYSSTIDWYWNKSQREEVLSKVKENGKIISYEIEGKRVGNNEKRWVLVSIFPIKYLDKDAFIVEMSDITDIKEANIKIHSQNLEISERNKYISDSINYAKRIQSSILPSDDYFKKLFPNYFLIFKPKDVVSGDFYWVNKVGSKKIVAAIDCTGHGVPGALMSMVGNTILNEIVTFGNITDPATILNKLNKRIIKELNKDVNQQTYDGMDVAICVIDEENKIMEYAGAYRPLNYFKDNEFFEIKGDRKSIGDIKKESVQYTTKSIELNESVIIYLYSDGYVDQHNEKNKKFGSKRLKKLLARIHTNNILEQQEILLTELETHKGNEVQRDDITILGIKPI